MDEENVSQNEETEESQTQETIAEDESAPENGGRRFFTRRNGIIALGLVSLLAVALVILVTVSYRYGVIDNYIKRQFVQKMADIGIVFEADVFRVTITPLQLRLENATFVDKTTGERLFTINEANIGLKVEDLYSWQLSRDLTVETTEINGAEVWVRFDENGNSNFSNLEFAEEGPGYVNFNYTSTSFALRNGLIHFGDAQHNISGDAKNVIFFLEPVDPAVPDDEKRYKFDITSTESNFVYDGNVIEPIDIRAQGITDRKGAEITELRLDSPLGTSVLNGRVEDWETIKYHFNITSTVDLTQTSNLLPVGTPLRGLGNFQGTVTGEGDEYKIEGEITSDALTASNIYLRGLNVNATVQGKESMYEANGKAIAELLTFEDFRIEFPQLIGNVRGTGTDFRWVGELQAAAAKSPLGTIGGLFITDAVAEYKDERLDATLGNVRAGTFLAEGTDVQNLRASNVKLTYQNENVDVNAPSLQAGRVKTEDATLSGVTANNVRIRNRGNTTTADVGNLRVENLETEDARLRNVRASDVNVQSSNNRTNIAAGNVQADGVDASGARIGNLTASNVDVQIVGDETRVYSNNLRVARVETDDAILGSLNIAGVRMTIRNGRIEAQSNDIDAGNVTLTASAVPEGGRLENVQLRRPVFVLEPSGRYRASADMSLGGGVLGSIQLGAVHSDVVATSDQIALNNLTADVMDGRLSGEATIAMQNRGRSNINAQFSNLNLGKLLALQGGRVVPLEGETTGQVNLSFPGTNFKQATGSVNADILATAGSAERGQIPVTGRVELTANQGLFNVNVANLRTNESQVSATGQFDLSGYDSNLNVALDSSNAAEIRRLISVLNLSDELEEQLNSSQVELAGNLNFKGTLTGNLTDPNVEGRASLERLIVRGQELGSVASDISVTDAGVELRNGVLEERDGGTLAFNVNMPSGGTNNISVQATLDRVNIGNILAALPVELPETFRNLQADTSGTLNLSGLPNAMQGEANIRATSGTIDGESFDNLEARATFAGNQVNIENFEAQFGAGFVRASGTYNTETTAVNLDITGKDVRMERLRPFIPNNADLPNIRGIVDLTAQITGQADQPSTYNVNFSGIGRDVTLDDRALGQVEFSGTTENQQLNTKVIATINGQQQEITANVNFADENLPFRAETVFNDTNLEPYINLAQLPGNVAVTGRATGRVLLEGNLRGINERGEREFSTEGLRGSAEFTQLSLQIDETSLVASEPVLVRFTPNEVIVENAKFAGSGTNVVVTGTYALNERGVNNLAINGSVNLRVLNAISEDAFFSGIAKVEVRLNGTSADPRLIGTAAVDNATVSVFVGDERLTVQRINGQILFTTNQAQIQELTGFLGGGRITASGGAVLEGLAPQAFRLNIQGNNVTAPLPSDFITTGDIQAEITGRRENDGILRTFISGTFNARRSLYTQDIDLADIINQRGGGTITRGGGSGDSFLGETRLDLRIIGRDALVVRNNLADLTASIDLRITGDIDEPQIAGRVTANSGTLFFRDNRYEVQRGILEFPPNTTFEPYI
ncbi:MAG TPA: translocation/assembly module TamB domain-containing protein, partial [Pyrinomonadaceae bacterium]|nr:translocation/assembly module TamB domain-containing protein [Pyrinomonadaceae bacterium]